MIFNIKEKFIVKYLLAITIGILVLVLFFKPDKTTENTSDIAFLNISDKWADSVIKEMSIEQKIGQLFVLKQDSLQNINSLNEIESYIKNYHISGVYLKIDSINSFVKFKKTADNLSKLPMFYASDFNTSGIIEIDEKLFVKNDLSLFATDSIVLLDNYYKKILYYYQKLGINMNFISFKNILKSEHKEDTSYINTILKKVLYNAKNLYENNIITSINQLPKVTDSLHNLLSFYKIFTEKPVPSFYINNSKEIDINLLKNKTDFGGLLICKVNDSSNIKSLLAKGTDIFILNKNIKFFVNKIRKMIDNNQINIASIDNKVKKILKAKHWSFKNKKISKDTIIELFSDKKNIVIKNNIVKNNITIVKNNIKIPFRINTDSKFLLITIGKNNLTTFKEFLNKYTQVDYKKISGKNIKKLYFPKKYSDIILAFNELTNDSVIKTVKKIISQKAKKENITLINFGNLDNIKNIENISTIVQVYTNSKYNQKVAAQVLFGGIAANGILPYKISKTLNFGDGDKTSKTRVAYLMPEENDIDSEKLLKIDSIAKFAVSIGAMPGCQVFVVKSGNVIYDKSFGYHTYSKRNKVTSNDVYDIASLTKIAATTIGVMKMIDAGKMALTKKLGDYFDNTKIEYTRIKPDTVINIDTLYIKEIKNMKRLLKYQDTIHLNDSMLVAYDTIIATLTPRRNIFKVKIIDMLKHKSGIAPAMPIFRYMLYKRKYIKRIKDSLKRAKEISNSKPDSLKTDSLKLNTVKFVVNADLLKKAFDQYYTHTFIEDSGMVEIAENLYLSGDFGDTVWRDTKQLAVYSRKIFVYSDVNMILLQMAVDSANDYSIDEYMKTNFYKPLGLSKISYKPLDYFDKKNIIPTEHDKLWRGQLLKGYVHDPSAAMLGGMAGNAGLYSNAKSLGILFQMLLNNGKYGGKKFISQKIIKQFTTKQDDTHRGLGFDMQGRKAIIGSLASKNSYGHTGYTGTCVWVDSDNELVYVFLSNRVHPSAKNWRINTYKIRQKIHNAIYESFIKKIK